MMSVMAAPMLETRAQVAAAAVVAGLVLGIGYTLSPMSVLCLPLLLGVVLWAGRGLTERQARWFVTLVGAAIVFRLAIIAVLFLTADPAQPFATLFGDEEFFKHRTLWIRNIGLGVPISKADFGYAYEEVGQSSYLYVLAYLQALLGDLPYGLHVLNATL